MSEVPISAVGDDRLWLDRAQRRGMSTAEALATFDALEPVGLAEMMGRWKGSSLRTGHRLDGALEAFGWYGKEFAGPEQAFPLLFTGDDGDVVAVDPKFLPVGLATRLGLVNSRMAARAFRLGKRLIATQKPTARLRLMEHRGKVSATMIYDALPINDIFRRIDADTLLGLMDYRGFDAPFFFLLRRA
jgi:hypothetical protein